MADTFIVQPRRGDPYKTTDYTKTLGNLFVNGYLPGTGNDFNIIDQGTPALDIKVDTGGAIIDGIFVNLSVLSDAKTLADNDTSFIFIELTKTGGRPSGAQIVVNLTDVAPVDSIKIGEVITSGGDITSVTQLDRVFVNLRHGGKLEEALFGDGSDGDLNVTSGTTTLTEEKYFNDVTIAAGATLTANQPMILFVKNILTVNGTLKMDGKGGSAGGGAGIGPSSPGAGGSPAPGSTPGGAGGAGRGLGGIGGPGTSGIAAITPGTPGTSGSPKLIPLNLLPKD